MGKRVLRFKPTCFAGTTNANSEVISNPEAITGFTPTLGGTTKIVNVTMHDANDNDSEPVSVYFFGKGDNDLAATLGDDVEITDANFLANVPFGAVALAGRGAGKHGDLIESKLYGADASIVVQAEKGTSEIYVAVVSNNTDFVSTASGLELIISVED